MSAAATSITVHVPMTIRQRGGRKLVVAPDGAPAWAPQRARVDSTMIKALARAFRWRRMLETGAVATVQGDRGEGEDQRLLRQPGAAADAAGAGRSWRRSWMGGSRQR